MTPPRRILCIDDEADIRKILTRVLQVTLGAEVAAVATGEEALAQLARAPLPEVILLDAAMPGTDGYQLCRQLRADRRFAEIPILFLTARRGRGERERMLAAGAQGYLEKPFDPLTLGEEIVALLARDRGDRDG